MKPNRRKPTPVYFSSLSDEWSTPQDFFQRLDREFGFELDVAARASNAKCPKFFTLAEDGLRQHWQGVTWCNPPYTRRQIGNWLKKAYESAAAGATVVCLIPSRTDSKFWHDYVMRASEIRFVRGRLKFSGAKTGAPFPNAVVVFRPPLPATPRLSVA
jgi:phage N-6-adenine-methyltransferase